jgi:hypothetical protein
MRPLNALAMGDLESGKFLRSSTPVPAFFHSENEPARAFPRNCLQKACTASAKALPTAHYPRCPRCVTAAAVSSRSRSTAIDQNNLQHERSLEE